MPKSEAELQRLLSLLPYLNRRKGEPIKGVARELGVTVKSLLKDLNRLSLCGIPPFGPEDFILSTVDEDGKLMMDFAGQFKAPLHLTPREALALRLVLLPLLEPRRGSYSRIFRSILAKIESALLPWDQESVDKLTHRMVAESLDRSSAEILDLLRRAREGKKTVEMVYYAASSGELAKRRIDPYGFLLHAGQWYVVAFSHHAKEEHNYKVSRIREAKLLEETYKIPAGFDITTYRSGLLFEPTGREQEVKVWFSPKVARWIVEENRDATKNKDGSAVLTLYATHFTWIARWILKYGDEARILAPQEAVLEVQKILNKRFQKEL